MLKKAFAVSVIIILTLLSVFTAYTESGNIIVITDDKSGDLYQVISNEKIRKITFGDNRTGEVLIPCFDSVSAFDGVLTFYDTDDLNRKLNIYRYSPYKDELDAFVIAENACLNPLCFKTDVDGNIYFVLADDSKVLCVYSKSEVIHIKVNAIIKQLLCDQNGRIIVATSNNILGYSEDGLEIICDTPPKLPLSFSGGQLIDCNNTPVTTAEPTETAISEATTPPTEAVFEEPPIFADLNADGKINKSDTMKILNHLSGKEVLSAGEESTADINGDKTLDLKDARELMRMY